MRQAITKLIFASAIGAAALGAGVRPSAAYGNAPWCAVEDLGSGTVVWYCYYWSVEQCVPHILAGNRGDCMLNPSWTGRYRHRPYRWRHR